MKKIILSVVFCMSILNAEKIIIENENNGFFNTVGSVELDVIEDKNFVEATINRGTLRINEKSKSNSNYIYGIRLCLSEYTNKGGWNTNICSERYNINKYIHNKETIQLNSHKFLIPNKKTSNEWYTIVIECKSGKGIGHCYIHHRDRSKTVRAPKIQNGISKEGNEYYKYINGIKIKVREIDYLKERIKQLYASNSELVKEISTLKNNKNHSQEWYRKKYEECKASLDVK